MGVWVCGKGWKHLEKISPLNGTNWKMCVLGRLRGQRSLRPSVGEGGAGQSGHVTGDRCSEQEGARLAQSWEPGRGQLTENTESGSQKGEQGSRPTCILFQRETRDVHKTLHFVSRSFVFIASLKSLHGLHASPADLGAELPWPRFPPAPCGQGGGHRAHQAPSRGDAVCWGQEMPPEGRASW